MFLNLKEIAAVLLGLSCFFTTLCMEFCGRMVRVTVIICNLLHEKVNQVSVMRHAGLVLLLLLCMVSRQTSYTSVRQHRDKFIDFTSTALQTIRMYLMFHTKSIYLVFAIQASHFKG